MSRRKGDFDDDEGFFESLLNRKDSVPMPDSMVKVIKAAAAFGVLFVVILIAWAVWPSGDKGGNGSVPIIRAETGDYKVEPDDKGGMIIPNKDSTIFETLDEDAGRQKKVENLLEDAEQPMKKAEVFVDDEAKPTDEPSEEKLASKSNEDDAVETATKKPETLIEQEAESSPKEEVKEVKKDEAPKVEKKEVAKVDPPKQEKKVDIIDALKEETGTKKADAAKPAPKGNVYIQLAAVKSDADAKTKWSQLKSKYSGLSALNLKVQKADLGAKGTFYRVQAGPTSSDNATKLCASIKAAKGDCMIVK